MFIRPPPLPLPHPPPPPSLPSIVYSSTSQGQFPGAHGCFGYFRVARTTNRDHNNIKEPNTIRQSFGGTMAEIDPTDRELDWKMSRDRPLLHEPRTWKVPTSRYMRHCHMALHQPASPTSRYMQHCHMALHQPGSPTSRYMWHCHMALHQPASPSRPASHDGIQSGHDTCKRFLIGGRAWQPVWREGGRKEACYPWSRP